MFFSGEQERSLLQLRHGEEMYKTQIVGTRKVPI